MFFRKKLVELKNLNISEAYLNRYNFDVEEVKISTILNNIFNNEVNFYAVSKSKDDDISCNYQLHDVVQ